jgi:DNA polymerase
MSSNGRVNRRKQLQDLRRKAEACRRCDLWKCGTQTVFGRGPINARVMVVGEQPGDQEDLTGKPFVGPAGRLLRDALDHAGIDQADVYFTNAVKHFKWEERGKRRIHERPNRDEILACRAWLDDEIAAVRPGAIVALGATAASVIVGSRARVQRDRAKPFASTLAPLVTVTVHPSSILRTLDAAGRKAARQQFLKDWGTITRLMNARATSRRRPS